MSGYTDKAHGFMMQLKAKGLVSAETSLTDTNALGSYHQLGRVLEAFSPLVSRNGPGVVAKVPAKSSPRPVVLSVAGASGGSPTTEDPHTIVLVVAMETEVEMDGNAI
jgi:hypothetical protein